MLSAAGIPQDDPLVDAIKALDSGFNPYLFTPYSSGNRTTDANSKPGGLETRVIQPLASLTTRVEAKLAQQPYLVAPLPLPATNNVKEYNPKGTLGVDFYRGDRITHHVWGRRCHPI